MNPILALFENQLPSWAEPELVGRVIDSFLISGIGFLVAFSVVSVIKRLTIGRLSKEVILALTRISFWIVTGFAMVLILNRWGINTQSLLFQKSVRGLLMLGVGIPAALLAGSFFKRLGTKKFSPEIGVMLSRVIAWLLFGVVVATVLNEFGVNLGAALGAAGIVGIAIGFAAQTSLSNVISGFFLLAEKPFRVGDLIEVDGVLGTVDRIGMISASVRTPDNKSVRIPNETLVKTNVANITGNPIRRYNLEVGVAYDEDIEHVMRVLREVAENNKLCLDEPNPLVLFMGFGDSSINFLFDAWMVREDYLAVRNQIAADVQKAFAREGIEIPFPHRVIAGGKAGVPIEVSIKGGDHEG